MSLASALVVLAPLPACTDVAGPETDEVTAADPGKADAASELKVRAGETTLWLQSGVIARVTGGRPEWVVRGRTSRTITGGDGFVFDDPSGDFATRSARSFEVIYPAGDGGVLAGGDHFVHLGFRHSAGKPDELTARAVIQASLTTQTGSSIYLNASLGPVVFGGRTMFRVGGRTSSAIQSLAAELDGAPIGPSLVRATDGTHFVVDLDADQVTGLVGGGELVIRAQLASGAREKHAHAALRVQRLGLTTGDATEAWPAPTCTGATRTCLGGLPDGTLDLGACGPAIDVLACQGQIGATFDGDAVSAALGRLDDRLGQSSFVADAQLLVGADRAAQFTTRLHAAVAGRYQDMVGQWFLSRTARDGQAEAVATAVVDRAYGFPLELVAAPHPAAPGDLVATRQVVADALLAHLAATDLAATEFGRPLEEMARVFRARHLDSLRHFRLEVTPTAVDAGHDVYAGNWLESLVEVTIDRTTGKVTNLLFEID